MDSSILTDIKDLVGIKNAGYTVFDSDIIVNINAAIGVLNQIGIGVDGFYVENDTQTWADFLGEDRIGFQIVKQYITLRTKIAFDSSTMSGSVLAAYQELIQEYEYRLNVMYETRDTATPVEMTPLQIHDLAGGEGGEP